VVSDGNWTHVKRQEILRGAVLLIVIAIRFIAGSRDAAAEIQTEHQSSQTYRRVHFEQSSRALHD
jgi:hypothetical protein